MKRLVLAVTVVLVLALGIMSCTPTTESDITTPTDGQEPEETPLDVNWTADRVRILSNGLDDLYGKYISRIVDDELSFEISLKMAVPAGLTGFPSYLTRFSVAYLESAITHVANAESLLTRGRLPTEQVSREVTPEEIADELEASMSLLQNRVEDTYTQQSNIIAWVEDFNNWIQEYVGYSWFQLSEEVEETAIRRYIDFFDEYREDLSSLISEHELILSRMD